MKDDLGNRMKGYENAYRLVFPERLPIIVRVDGRAFHTFTRQFEKPFDDKLIEVMNKTAMHLCEEMQGALFAYVQSDEISVLLYPWKTMESQAWFGNNLNKIVSVSAAEASSVFTHMIGQRAAFDARAFVLPNACEVANYFLWRTKDCIRNSVSSCAQAKLSPKQLRGMKLNTQKMLLLAEDFDWDALPWSKKNGRIVGKGFVAGNPLVDFRGWHTFVEGQL